MFGLSAASTKAAAIRVVLNIRRVTPVFYCLFVAQSADRVDEADGGLLLKVLIDRRRLHARTHVTAIVVALLIQHHQLIGILYRQGRNMSWSISVKMAVFAPIPKAKERMATVAKSGLLRIARRAYRRSGKRLMALGRPPADLVCS